MPSWPLTGKVRVISSMAALVSTLSSVIATSGWLIATDTTGQRHSRAQLRDACLPAGAHRAGAHKALQAVIIWLNL